MFAYRWIPYPFVHHTNQIISDQTLQNNLNLYLRNPYIYIHDNNFMANCPEYVEMMCSSITSSQILTVHALFQTALGPYQ